VERWENRYGPKPILERGDVLETAKRQSDVMRYLAHSAKVEYPPPIDSPDWFQIALAGFNYVDEACSEYLHDVFIRDREKQRASGLISAGNTATSAVLTATSASKAALSVAAALFGLASGVTVAVTNSYLFAVPPSTIVSTVEKMQVAYREKTLAEAKAGHLMLSEPAIYGRIRDYLQLCLPETIESRITAVVASAGTTTTPPTPPPAKTNESAASETAAKVRVELTAQ
jgi:hypothetical protein